jgi:hypothetical protein
MKYLILLLISFNAFAIVGTGANQVPSNGMLGRFAFVDQMPLTLSASVSATEVITENDQLFLVSCTDAAPSVCTIRSDIFLSDPKCWAGPVASGTTALVSADTTTSVTVERTANTTAFKLFCHGIIK